VYLCSYGVVIVGLTCACLQLEGSSRWPDDPKAIFYLKIAMLLKIAERFVWIG